MTELAAAIREAVRDDRLEELTVRVMRFGADGKPEAWQAIAKYTDRVTGPWGVGIRANPIAAIDAALVAGRDEGDVFG